MKNLKHFTRAFAIHAMIFSLIQSSFIFSAYADTKMSNTEATGKEILGVANVALQTYGQFLGAKQQMIGQQIAAQRNQQMMQQLSPGCRKPDGTACYTVAGQFFPECPIPASMTAMPQNVCSAASPDPAAISSMISYEAISKSWVNYFDQMLNEASNAKMPFGLKCLQDKQKALDSQLTEMVNNLTRLQDQLNKDKETFKANNKKLLEDMKQTNDELMGSSGGNNLALKTKDFSKYFSQSCQSVIGEEALAMGAAKGLNGIMQDLSPSNKRAADYNSNKAMVEADLRRDIDKIQKTIADGGLQDYFDGKITESSKFQSLVSATQKQSAEFKLAKERIAKELGKIGYDLPTMDKNFAVDFDEFLKGSTSFFKKQYINDCVTGADKSGTAISTEQILSSLKQISTGSSGTARDKYKAALQTILNSDAFIEDKLNQIKALENTYKDISITYQNANAQRVTSTPYDLYMKTLAACETRYSQDDTFSASGNNGVSQKKKVERGQSLLRDLKNLHDNYSSQLGSRVLEQVMNCNGEAKKSGAACGDKASFDTSAPSFCMAQANQCANEVQGCYAEANKHVETRKAKLEAQATTFNNNAAALVARSNALYKAQTNAVMDMVKVVQARFPGTNFEIPSGMFISMPEMKKDSFGVDMANDGNIAFMDELPKKIDLLKKVFKDQQSAANEKIGDYLNKQTIAMKTERDRWSSLAGDCKGMIDTSSREVAKMNNENMKKQAEMDGKVRSFCRKYQALAEHPVGGCDNAKKLSGEVDDVMSRILPTVVSNVNEFNGVCNAYGNVSDSASSGSSVPARCTSTIELGKMDEKNRENCLQLVEEDTRKRQENGKAGAKKGAAINIKALCGTPGKPNDNVTLVAKILSKLPEAEQKKFASKEKKDSLVEAIQSNTFEKVEGLDTFIDGDAFANIAELVNPLETNKHACEKLLKIDAAKSPADVSADKKKLADESAQLAILEADIKKSATPMAADMNKKSDEIVAKKKEIAELEKKIADAEKAAPANSEAEKKAGLTLMISSLSDAASRTTPLTEVKREELSRIGQQIDANTICDSQAVNNNLAKAFSGGLLPSGFDASVLGQSK